MLAAPVEPDAPGVLVAPDRAWQILPRAAELRQLVAELQAAGFVLVVGGKGSHRKLRHPDLPGALVLSGDAGDDAKPYQEKQVRNAIRKVSR